MIGIKSRIGVRDLNQLYTNIWHQANNLLKLRFKKSKFRSRFRPCLILRQEPIPVITYYDHVLNAKRYAAWRNQTPCLFFANCPFLRTINRWSKVTNPIVHCVSCNLSYLKQIIADCFEDSDTQVISCRFKNNKFIGSFTKLLFVYWVVYVFVGLLVLFVLVCFLSFLWILLDMVKPLNVRIN